MTDVYTELLQENSELKTKVFRLEQENRELSFAIEKCLENAGIECDDEEQALRSLPMLGNAHYKVLVEKEKLEQENRELRFIIEKYKSANERLYDAKVDDFNFTLTKYRSALEEIREVLKLYADTWVDEKIYPNLHYDNTKAKEGLSKINEVLQ